ncbi:MAG: response regulator transcription factor [Steroidobacteraceae bacterium]|jgi:DNA-binding response OmpR family regulator|nr:response regulator transcription factor [Steroidobacteraceae bacterium]
MRILLVEDDELIGDGIATGLRDEGHAVDWVQDGDAALAALGTHEYAAVVLDLGLPGRNGLEVLRRMRAGGNRTPVMILTARAAVDERVAGLDAGADDYLAKPFALDELGARLRAIARRAAGRAAPVLASGRIELDPAAHAVTVAGKAVTLSAREFSLMQLLMENAGRVLPRERLEQALYGWNEEVESNAVEVHIHHLRRKLGKESIVTVRGVGYTVPRDPA